MRLLMRVKKPKWHICETLFKLFITVNFSVLLPLMKRWAFLPPGSYQAWQIVVVVRHQGVNLHTAHWPHWQSVKRHFLDSELLCERLWLSLSFHRSSSEAKLMLKPPTANATTETFCTNNSSVVESCKNQTMASKTIFIKLQWVYLQIIKSILKVLKGTVQPPKRFVHLGHCDMTCSVGDCFSVGA